MKIIPFEEKYRKDFIDFNTDWIISNFGFLEEHDKQMFDKIDDEIKAGAMIFFAVENGSPEKLRELERFGQSLRRRGK